MEVPTRPILPISMMLALTRAYNSSKAFQKFHVDASVMLDPTRTREECEIAIKTQMDLHMSKNPSTGVTIPAAFIAQDYSAEIAELRNKRKIETKSTRKTKLATDSESDDVAVKRKRVGRKTKRVAIDSESEAPEVASTPANNAAKAAIGEATSDEDGSSSSDSEGVERAESTNMCSV